MISTKVGTANWSKAPQSVEFKDAPQHFESATSQTLKDEADGKNIGERLNQIANPNGEDASKKVRKAHNTLDKDDFLKLMLTQMKNQDPMNPLQSHEMAAQLAQFTSLEQLVNVNKNLEGMTKAQEPSQRYQALSFLGKKISADSREVMRQQGDTVSDLRFNLGMDATKVKVTISDDQGQVVKEMDLGGLKKGANKMVWNGTDLQGREVKPGHFVFNVEAENSSGRKVSVLTATAGLITGVNFTSEGPMLMVGDQRVRLRDVQKIEDDEAKEKQVDRETPLSQTEPEQKVRPSMAVTPKAAPPKLVPESKPQARYNSASLPLEVASSNIKGPAKADGAAISAGGAFGNR